MHCDIRIETSRAVIDPSLEFENDDMDVPLAHINHGTHALRKRDRDANNDPNGGRNRLPSPPPTPQTPIFTMPQKWMQHSIQ